jgi:predicted transcriptional regulator
MRRLKARIAQITARPQLIALQARVDDLESEVVYLRHERSKLIGIMFGGDHGRD